MTCWICWSLIMLLLFAVVGGLRVRSRVRRRSVVQAPHPRWCPFVYGVNTPLPRRGLRSPRGWRAQVPISRPVGVQRGGAGRREARRVVDDADPPGAVPGDGATYTRAVRAAPPGPVRTPLDRRRVLAAAIEFIDEHGL